MTGERSLINSLLKFQGAKHQDTLVPAGDDAFVFSSGDALHCISTDSFSEGIHFSRDYFSPAQVGEKVYEATVSDIIAMGGKPQSVFLSIALPENFDHDAILEMYKSIEERALVHGVEIGGGETTGSPSPDPLITVTAFGTLTSAKHLCTRSGASSGDSIYVTGTLGGSAAGLKALSSKMAGMQTIKNKHLHPRARIDVVDIIAPLATSMIDISDGLSSELYHICQSSNCGACIEAENIPLEEETRELATLTGVDPLNFALGGGEDFELLFTSSEEIPAGLATCIGEITAEQGVYIKNKTGKTPLPLSGYDHFTTD